MVILIFEISHSHPTCYLNSKLLQVELKLKEDFFPCSNTRDVPVKFYITYIITSNILLDQLGYLLLMSIVILI